MRLGTPSFPGIILLGLLCFLMSGCESVPAAPTGLTATAGNGQATVAWTAVSDATSYNIYWSTTAGVTTGNGTLISGVTSPYVQAGLSGGTTYYYVVTAVNSHGESLPSSVASVTLGPTGVAAVSGPSNGQITVSWTATSGATSYNIYWSTSPGVTTANGTEILGATSPYTQAGLTSGTTYYYVVTSVSTSGESSASTQVNAIAQ